jgi:hypothetical protein
MSAELGGVLLLEGLSCGPERIDDVQVLEAERHQLTVEQLRHMMGWAYGADGQQLADLWQALNLRLWDGSLDPVPMWLPTCTDWGRWIGLYTHNGMGRSLSIQVKWQLSPSDRAGVLLHEMVHQALAEARQCTAHNAMPWCQQIMRITWELWGVRIWASPSVPRRVAGKSKRVQVPSPDGRPSISRRCIASWPHSLGLQVPVLQLLEQSDTNAEGLD